MKHSLLSTWLPALTAALLSPVVAMSADPRADWVVEDVFGRQLNQHGLVLVDWDGYLANPAIKFFIVPPTTAHLPAKVVLTAREPRLYFDLPSETGAGGPRKEITFQKAEKAPVYISIFPDRDGEDEDHELKLTITDAKGREQTLRLPVHVIDQDRPRKPAFPIHLDFSQDRTGFFKDAQRRAVVTQAAEDWAAFFTDMSLRPVAASDERTFIWNPDGFKNGRVVTNAEEYTGYRLYAYGIQCDLLRSGGEPSRDGGFQVGGGKQLPLRRSGGLEIEVQGNYNRKGWLVQLADADWWKASNLQHEANDLYSIAHHEIGHALFFNPHNPLFEKAKKQGKLQYAAVRAYLGTDPAIDKSDHWHGTIDPASRRGAFGYEYHGDVPRGRWLITKFDLLCAQALGYQLRDHPAFAPVRLLKHPLPTASLSRRYSAPLRAEGGIPFYHWEVVAGTLPDGLTLDSFTGEIAGMPRTAGTFEFTVQVRDYDEKAKGQKQPLRLLVSDDEQGARSAQTGASHIALARLGLELRDLKPRWHSKAWTVRDDRRRTRVTQWENWNVSVPFKWPWSRTRQSTRSAPRREPQTRPGEWFGPVALLLAPVLSHARGAFLALFDDADDVVRDGPWFPLVRRGRGRGELYEVLPSRFPLSPSPFHPSPHPN